MGATHRTLYRRPDGVTVELLLDESNPEDARVIAELAREGDPTLAPLDARARGEIAREQYTANVRQSVEQSPLAVRLAAQLGQGVIGAVDGLTAGFDQVLLRGIMRATRPEEAARFEAAAEGLREASPEGRTLGYIGGVVLPALATGGSTLGQRSLATVTAGGFTNQVNNTIARAVAARLAPRLGEPTARIVGSTLGAAADGAISGALDAVAEANIEDSPYSGERMLAGMGFGALAGLALGPIGGALDNRVVSATTPAQREAVEALQEAGLARAYDPDVRVDYSRLRDLEPAAQRDALNEIARRSPVLGTPEAQAEFDIFYQNIDRALDDRGWARAAGQDLRAQLDDVVSEIERGAGREALDAGARHARYAREAAGASVQQVDEGIAGLRAAARHIDAQVPHLSGAAAGSMRALRGRLDDLADSMEFRVDLDGRRVPLAEAERVASAQDAARQLDLLLDELPRHGGEEHALTGLLNGTEAGADDVTRAGLRGILRRAGERWAPSFDTLRQARDAYDTALANMRRFGRREAGGAWRFDGRALGAELAAPQRTVRGTARDNLHDWFLAADRLLEASGDTAVRASILPSAFASLEDVVQWGQAVGARLHLEGLEAGAAGVQAGVGNKLMWMLGGMAGIASGNPALAAAGIGIAMAGHPVSLVRNLHGIRRMLGRTGERARAATGRLRTALESPRLVSGSAARRAALGGRQVPRVVLALHSPRERQETYDRVVAQVRQFAANPQLLLDHVATMTEELGATNPGVAQGVAYSAVAGILHLAAHLPPPNPPSPFPVRPRRPSAHEMEDLTRRLEAIEDPLSVLERAADGTLTSAHVDAVRATYPRLYAEMVAEMGQIMTGLTEPPPYQMRVRMGLLLGMPTDPSMDPTFVWAAQQTFAQSAAQNEAQLGRGPQATMSTRVATDTMSRATSVTHNL